MFLESNNDFDVNLNKQMIYHLTGTPQANINSKTIQQFSSVIPSTERQRFLTQSHVFHVGYHNSCLHVSFHNRGMMARITQS